MTAALAFDVLLVASVLAVAAGAILARNLLRAVVLFITFGLLMSLAWLRLDAPDVALAEAAIGAGLTGVLLLDTLGYLSRRSKRPSDAP
jgi:energy-converting hydrogenase B subunit D